MKLKFIEATNHAAGGFNWGKFGVGRFEPGEWAYRSLIADDSFVRPRSDSLLVGLGWDHAHIFVLDLATGEGAIFRHGGLAPADLNKHQIWVCPLFEPFLAWLYKQDVADLDGLPATVELDAPSSMHGYRRAGPEPRSR